MNNLVGKTTSEIENILRELGEKPFRGRQIAAWIYRRGATSFDEMNDLSHDLRAKLDNKYSIQFPNVAERFASRDGSEKL